jgi:hypothetical protein
METNARLYYSREAEMQVQRERFVLSVIVAALGIAFGAAVALMLAPYSGEKSRRMLAKSAEAVASNVQHGLEKAREEVGERMHNG